jgi:hypothetical protein
MQKLLATVHDVLSILSFSFFFISSFPFVYPFFIPHLTFPSFMIFLLTKPLMKFSCWPTLAAENIISRINVVWGYTYILFVRKIWKREKRQTIKTNAMSVTKKWSALDTGLREMEQGAVLRRPLYTSA